MAPTPPACAASLELGGKPPPSLEGDAEYAHSLELKLVSKSTLLDEAVQLHQSLQARVVALEQGISWKDAQLEALARQFEEAWLRMGEASRERDSWRERAEHLEEENCVLRDAVLEHIEQNDQLRQLLEVQAEMQAIHPHTRPPRNALENLDEEDRQAIVQHVTQQLNESNQRNILLEEQLRLQSGSAPLGHPTPEFEALQDFVPLAPKEIWAAVGRGAADRICKVSPHLETSGSGISKHQSSSPSKQATRGINIATGGSLPDIQKQHEVHSVIDWEDKETTICPQQPPFLLRDHHHSTKEAPPVTVTVRCTAEQGLDKHLKQLTLEENDNIEAHVTCTEYDQTDNIMPVTPGLQVQRVPDADTKHKHQKSEADYAQLLQKLAVAEQRLQQLEGQQLENQRGSNGPHVGEHNPVEFPVTPEICTTQDTFRFNRSCSNNVAIAHLQVPQQSSPPPQTSPQPPPRQLQTLARAREERKRISPNPLQSPTHTQTVYFQRSPQQSPQASPQVCARAQATMNCVAPGTPGVTTVVTQAQPNPMPLLPFAYNYGDQSRRVSSNGV